MIPRCLFRKKPVLPSKKALLGPNFNVKNSKFNQNLRSSSLLIRKFSTASSSNSKILDDLDAFLESGLKSGSTANFNIDNSQPTNYNRNERSSFNRSGYQNRDSGRREFDRGSSEGYSRDSRDGGHSRDSRDSRDGGYSRDGGHSREGGRRDFDRGSQRGEFTSSEPLTPEETLWKQTDVVKSDAFDYAKYEEAEVSIKGENAPKPCQTWEQMKLDSVLIDNALKAGFKQPVAMQKYVIPAAIEKRDLIMTAQTGSGKTAAFLFPVITRLAAIGKLPRRLRNENGGATSYPRALILGPTRELAQQIYVEARQFCIGTGIKPTVVFGGAPYFGQYNETKSGQPIDILIGTPGRVGDFLSRRNMSMEDIQFLVFDEADRMLDMGFEDAIRDIVENWKMPRNRQTMMFSATFPREIQQMANSYLHRDNLFMSFGRVGAAAELVEQNIVRINHEREREERLMHTVQQHLKESSGNILVFFDKKSVVDEFFWRMKDQGIKCTSIHGDKTQAARNSALHSFATGQTRVLLATSVAARGLDLKNIDHVINYSLPQDMDDYVHRIGRTGRAGKKGLSTTFVGSRDTRDAIKKLITILQEAKKEVPAFLEEMLRDAYSDRPSFSGNRRGSSSGRASSFRKPFSRGGEDMDFGEPPRREFRGGRYDNRQTDSDLDQKFDELFARFKK